MLTAKNKPLWSGGGIQTIRAFSCRIKRLLGTYFDAFIDRLLLLVVNDNHIQKTTLYNQGPAKG